MHDNIDHYDIYKADGCIKKSKITGFASILIMGAILYEVYNGLLKFMHFLIMDALDRPDLTPEDLDVIENIIVNKYKIIAVLTAVIGLVFILAPLIRTIVTISKCSAASSKFNSTGNTLNIIECARYLRKKYTKTCIAFFVFALFFLSAVSTEDTDKREILINIDFGFLLLYAPALLYVIFASKAAKLCGDTGRTVSVQSSHTDRCGERDHHYDYVSGEQKDCYGKHEYDSYSEYESYSDDYDYFANDDRFKIDMNRYDFSSAHDTHYTDTDDEDRYR